MSELPSKAGVIPFPYSDPTASVDLIDPSSGTFYSLLSPGIQRKFTVQTGGGTNIATGSLNYTSPAELSGSQSAVVNIVTINGQGRLGITFTGGSGKTAQVVRWRRCVLGGGTER
ncbi:hypothetical protein FRC10_009126 [Ceratobasidium sp. 414]|nr:hypothetical protein FRC10_009126 [Ceratobasidium sp. 414]